MSKLIEFKHIYENKACTDTKKFLIFIKNILANCKKERLFHYPEGYLIPIRWSELKKSFVVDLGTNLNRDTLGIDLNNLSLHFNKDTEYFTILENLLKSLDNNKLNEYYNIKKNQSKFIAVIYCLKLKKYFNIGLYSFVKTNKRAGVYHKNKKSVLIDNSRYFKENIYNFCNMLYPSNSYIIKSYRTLYEDLIKFLKTKKYVFLLKNNNITIDLQKIIENNLSFDFSLTNKRNKEIIKTNQVLVKEESTFEKNIARYLLADETYNFLIEKEIINNSSYYYDDQTDTNYKIKSIESVNFDSKENMQKKNKCFNPYLLMPLKF